MNRRTALRAAAMGLAASQVGAAFERTTTATAALGGPPPQGPRPANPEQALQALVEGNRRFLAGNFTFIDDLQRQRGAAVSGQSPFACIVSCSDSRVPPEIIFEHGVGDLFVVRTAGQVIDDAARASIEFSVEVLGATLVLVVGHESCGAVDGTIQRLQGASLPGFLYGLVSAIGPAVRPVLDQPGDVLENAIRANVEYQVRQIRTAEPILEPAVRSGRIAVRGAVYSFRTGQVNLL